MKLINFQEKKNCISLTRRESDPVRTKNSSGGVRFKLFTPKTKPKILFHSRNGQGSQIGILHVLETSFEELLNKKQTYIPFDTLCSLREKWRCHQ